MTSLISNKFLSFAKTQNKQSALIAYLCSGYPNDKIFNGILNKIAKSGVDLLEIGVPFLDPAGDGPIIENAGKIAIKNGATLKNTIKNIANFRNNSKDCVASQAMPIILMTYYNPIFTFGVEKFFIESKKAGINGVLIVDLPLEEQKEARQLANNYNIDFINLISPITKNDRIAQIVKNSSGFLYLISMLGITGTVEANFNENRERINNIRQIIAQNNLSNLPIAVGFGIKNKENLSNFNKIGANGVVVGSAIIEEIGNLFSQNEDDNFVIENTIKFIENLANF